MYDFKLIDNGAIVYSARGVAVVITKTTDGYNYTDKKGCHMEGYATRFQCLTAVLVGLSRKEIVPIE